MTDAAEMPEGWERSPQGQWLVSKDVAASFTDGVLHVTAMHCGAHLPLPVLRALLATQGLHIVSAKDVRVLEASASAPASELRLVIDLAGHPTWEVRHAEAELARRKP